MPLEKHSPSESPPNDPLPPAYQDVAPPPDITAGFANLNLSGHGSIPSVDECVAHLKLLEAFNQLKEDITRQDGLYGLKDSFATGSGPEAAQNDMLTKIREKRWVIYVTIAVRRFQVWFQTLIPDSRMPTRTFMSEVTYDRITDIRKHLHFSVDSLPPLDVLMVLHSFLLNPRSWLADCIRFGKMELWATGIPWAAVAAAIDNETFSYTPSGNAKTAWEVSTESPWSLLDESPSLKFTCPQCKNKVDIPWTTCDSYVHFTAASALDSGRGFADPGFSMTCYCGLKFNHDYLRSAKFVRDLQKLLTDDIPMPGGYLNLDGKPMTMNHPTHTLIKTETFYLSFPSRMLKEGGLAKEFSSSAQKQLTRPDDIRNVFEAAIKDPKYTRRAISTPSSRPRVRRDERIGVRKMMACYWDNSSIFSMDLVGAVIRQGVFVEKMHGIDWLHSPALSHTMGRLIAKYERFTDIMAANPRQVVVPTLDVDLAW